MDNKGTEHRMVYKQGSQAMLEARNEMLEVLKKHSEGMTALELLAIVCQTVGQLVVWQDQTRYTNVEIMKIVVANITEGREIAMRDFMEAKSPGGVQ